MVLLSKRANTQKNQILTDTRILYLKREPQFKLIKYKLKISYIDGYGKNIIIK